MRQARLLASAIAPTGVCVRGRSRAERRALHIGDPCRNGALNIELAIEFMAASSMGNRVEPSPTKQARRSVRERAIIMVVVIIVVSARCCSGELAEPAAST